ncbi:GNAT family N-acetyltransferase [Microbacterium sp. M1A1_1b]|uniref:GNAT family N-acetyltransferase n=1 Tax=Curtobacterium sp. VKM Ac-2922 TaxID=2929475 RepID=UPI001FB56364|nr:GNAT family N-acetyltransferase [Curtobacterium sp. VKM Ac-2922]MCJ1712682.1 GNAT family N-acetyltransferase [Curtobacterium sp. VKM Ac-2922]
MSWPRADDLHTERVSLEPLTEQHASEMVTALAAEELYRFTGGGPPTLIELEERYRRQSRGQSEDGTAGWMNWIIRPVAGGPAIGFVQATLARQGPALDADLAWLVTVSEQGRGLAVEATAAVVRWLTSIGVGRVRAFIRPDHTASQRVAERLGLVPTSTHVDGEVLWSADTSSTTDRPGVVRELAPHWSLSRRPA